MNANEYVALQKDAQESLRHMNEVVPRIGALYQAALDAQQAYRTFVGHFIDMGGPRIVAVPANDVPGPDSMSQEELAELSEAITAAQGTQP